MAKRLAFEDLKNCVEIVVNGIEMIVYISKASYTPPDSKANNPEDCKGGWDIEYTIYDTDGYKSEELDNMVYGRAEEIEVREQIANIVKGNYA